MTTAKPQPATPLPEHDLTVSPYNRHASDFGAPDWVFDSRCRRCWHDRALADLAPLHRQMVEALEAVSVAIAKRLEYETHRPDQAQGQNMTLAEKQLWDEAGRGTYLLATIAQERVQAALDAARKAP